MAVPGATRGGLTAAEWNRAVAEVEANYDNRLGGYTYTGFSEDSQSSSGSSGCQAGRTPQLPTFDFGRGILKLASFFGGIPAMPSILQKMK